MQATKTDPAVEEKTSWLDRPFFSLFTLNLEFVLFVVIMLGAIFTRFYLLEPRVMSHDETSHVYFSWLLEQGRGYAHDPVTHGPFQFHIVALSYFLFGDSDFTARIPVVLFSIATIGFMWHYRRYLGRAGALIAAVLFTISPYMLYYGRYVRNESFVAFYGVVTLWAVLRYLETGRHRYLYYLTAATVMHVATKETSYIYTAQLLLFLAFYLIYRVTTKPWKEPLLRSRFLYGLMAGFGFLAAGAAVHSLYGTRITFVGDEMITTPARAFEHPLFLVLLFLALVGFAVAGYFLLRGYTLPALRRERVFDLLILQGTLVLPLLTAFPLDQMGWEIPTGAASVQNMGSLAIAQVAITMLIMFLLAIGIGIWWNRDLWLGNAALFFAVFTVLFTTVFTNGAGFVTGMIGGLGYWLSQQEVQRGGQPWYYYALIQVPFYEYLPLLGSFLAAGLAIAGKRLGALIHTPGELPVDGKDPQAEDAIEQPPVFSLFAFWAVTSLLAFSIAGEKMPWLTVHIALPMILLAALALGYMVDTTQWRGFRQNRGLLLVALVPVFLISLTMALSTLFGTNPPFQGRELPQLQATSTFITALLTAAAVGFALGYLFRSWRGREILRLFGLVLFGLLGILTMRSAFISSYIHYDNATEYLVYAHSGPGNKTALQQVEELSRRTTDGLALQIAYDDATTYPFWWYFRDFTNLRFFGDSPTRDLRDAPVILVGDRNYHKIDPIVGQAYYSFEYIRIWWPNQDYFFLTWERLWDAITDRQMRTAIFRIWLNRDYTLYGQLSNRDMSLPRWEPAERMRLYIRKDVAAQVWEYGTAPTPEQVIADPYEQGTAALAADVIIGATGAEPGSFNMPRNLTFAPDGSLYVADTNNHRIQHLAPDGSVLHVWGTFSGGETAQPAQGAFYEPWGIAVGPDGSVYVTDTWNHRIQRFTADGEFIQTWGFLGQAETPYAFWGPRGVVVDGEGRVMVADTGNKRIAIFDASGEFLGQFGTSGMGLGQFNEPVGLALAPDGSLYVSDTWNQRVQMFQPDGNGLFTPVREWEIFGWYGQSLDNKPFIAAGPDGSVFVTDPEGYRILQFNSQGEFIRTWGDAGVTPERFRLPTGITVGPDGAVWITDAGNGRIMRFPLP
jgi:predicted membrane-bound mannosyltransferase/DNA-binding beta-propeller fold protein YncE